MMSFRKEVRVFIQDMRMMSKVLREFVKTVTLENKIYDKILERQKEEIQELRDRLLARDLPEYKTYEIRGGRGREEVGEYKPEEDDTNAGEVMSI